MSISSKNPDLNLLWDLHCQYEFADRDPKITMETMVAEPYVNNIPTMTGGNGWKEVFEFYRDHFISKVPADTKIMPVSRTIGETTVVDEIIFCFTHDCVLDFMLPGIPPTGKYVEIPLVAIVQFEGDKISHEHIYWDQASVLVQLGLLDATVLPIAGSKTAKKMRDRSLPFNSLIERSCQPTKS